MLTAILSAGCSHNRAAAQIIKEAQDAYAALSSYSDTGTVVTESAGVSNTTAFSIRMQRPDLYWIAWTQQSSSYTMEGAVWSDGSGNFIKIGKNGTQKLKNRELAIASATGISASAAATVPGTFFHQHWGDVLGPAALGRESVRVLPDEKVGEVDCDVISYKIGPPALPETRKPSEDAQVVQPAITATTLWIGKEDHLIHKCRTSVTGGPTVLPIKDDALKQALEQQHKPATPEAVAAYRAELESKMKETQIRGVVFTQTHQNISVDRHFAPSNFRR